MAAFGTGSIFPATFQRITDEPRQVFYDPFDAALDTINTWTTPTTGNSAVTASVTSGVMSIGTGTTASGWSKLFSLNTFKLSIPAWTGFSFAINLPDGAAPTANSYRFWGSGTPATTPTTAAPMTDAVGFEIDTAGKMYAVVYAAGVRTVIQDLSTSGNSKQPLNTASHRYIIYVRTDKSYWYIDGLGDAQLVATSNFQAPSIQTLPLALLAVGGSTPPASNTQIQSSGLAVWDTGKNATKIADGTYPWRTAQISSTGALKIETASKNTYRGSTTAVLVTAVTSPNPFFTIYGSATKTIRIQSIIISGLTLTAVAYLNIGLRKYSVASLGGTSTALTQVPLDANNAAGTATNLNVYTVAPIAGTVVGDITSRRVIGQSTTAAAAGIPQVVDFDFSSSEGTPVILRGTTQGIGLYWITAPATTVSMLLKIEWTEE